jgi:hypothetical protein
MSTNTSTSGFISCEDEPNITIMDYEPAARTQGGMMLFFRRLWKWFSILLTFAWGAAAFAPDAFNVPLPFRPWIFVSFIFWFFTFCTGFFNS